MKLAKLLSVGRCFGGGADSGRYKMNSEHRLPSFSKHQPSRKSYVALVIRWITGGWRTKDPIQGAGPNQTEAGAVALFSSSEIRVGGRSGPGEPGPIQAELALERVRVVRNDLSDSDIEVISGGKSPFRQRAATPAPARRETRVALKREKGWNRLSARLFVAGRSEF